MVHWRHLLQAASAAAAQAVHHNLSAPLLAPPHSPSLFPPPTVALPPPSAEPRFPPVRPPPASPLLSPPPFPSPGVPPPWPQPPAPARDGVCLSLSRPQGSFLWVLLCYSLLALPLLLFLAFLVAHARHALARLRHTGSLVMSSYYALLWAVCVVNLIRCVIEALRRPDGSAAAAQAWNWAWMLSRFFLVFLEASVVVFLFQGYLVSGTEALARTAIISGAVAGGDTLLKALLIFRFHVALFLPGEDSVGGWALWGFWSLHHLLAAAVYATILTLPLTRYHDRLPARPAFYQYIAALLAIDAVSAVGSLMLALGMELGFCVHGAAGYLHSALFPPLLYFTFLADFFKNDDLLVEDAYYSEMKETGYFEDWD